MKTKNSKGFSVIELMVTVSILAVLVAVASPSLSNFVERRQVSALSGNISSALSVARAEALAQLRNISVCWNDEGSSINSDGIAIPSRSMVVFLPSVSAVNDVNEDGDLVEVTPAVQSVSIRAVQYADSQTVVVDNIDSNCITYDSQGRVTSGAVIFGICKNENDASDSEAVTVTLAGRSLVQSNDNNSLIQCDS